MMTPEMVRARRAMAVSRRRIFVVRRGETAGQPFDSLLSGQSPKQDRAGAEMVKALRRWLEANELFAIITAVLCTLVLLSLLMVLGGYLFVTR
jgi:hypothetical protein